MEVERATTAGDGQRQKGLWTVENSSGHLLCDEEWLTQAFNTITGSKLDFQHGLFSSEIFYVCE